MNCLDYWFHVINICGCQYDADFSLTYSEFADISVYIDRWFTYDNEVTEFNNKD